MITSRGNETPCLRRQSLHNAQTNSNTLECLVEDRQLSICPKQTARRVTQFQDEKSEPYRHCCYYRFALQYKLDFFTISEQNVYGASVCKNRCHTARVLIGLWLSNLWKNFLRHLVEHLHTHKIYFCSLNILIVYRFLQGFFFLYKDERKQPRNIASPISCYFRFILTKNENKNSLYIKVRFSFPVQVGSSWLE